MKCTCMGVLILLGLAARTQELFVFTEPASNMATKSIGWRLNNSFSPQPRSTQSIYQLAPEIMWGATRKLMVHAECFLSNQYREFTPNGAALYLKYRIYSADDVQQHFRLALFVRGSFSNSPVLEEDINLNGYNSGTEAGIVATQLLHKVALSSSFYWLRALDNGNHKFPSLGSDQQAVNYTLSVGKLMLPTAFRSYKQTNMTLMLELLSQLNTGSGKYYIDAAPSVQFIVNSQSRIDIGYQKQLSSTLRRIDANTIFLRFEYNLFNVY